MVCESTIPVKDGYDKSWCDGSDELAYKVKVGGRWQAIAVKPGVTDDIWLTEADKIEHLPRDHWHAGLRQDQGQSNDR